MLRAKQTDATQACHKRGIVIEYEVTVEGAWAIFVILQQKRSNFYVFLFALRTF